MRKFAQLSVAIFFGLIAAVSALAAQPAMVEHPSKTAPDIAAAIHQEVDFTASPARLYQALLDTRQFTEFSGAPAEIHPELGGACTLFGGLIVARNLELVPNQRIVQAWRVAAWPEGRWSIVKFELKAQGSGTHLVFDHTGFPGDQLINLTAGWESHYWSTLKKYLR